MNYYYIFSIIAIVRGQERPKQTSNHGNERSSVSAATRSNVYSVGSVNCLFPRTVVSQSHDPRSHIACGLIPYAVQYCRAKRLHNDDQGLFHIVICFIRRIIIHWTLFPDDFH